MNLKILKSRIRAWKQISVDADPMDAMITALEGCVKEIEQLRTQRDKFRRFVKRVAGR